MNKYEKKNPVPEALSIKIHIEAIIENLVAFHNKTREQAEAGVKALHLDNNTVMLKSDPYLLAYELAHPDTPKPTPQQVRMNKSIASRIFEAANRKFMFQR